MGDEKKEVKTDKNENVIIPYALFEKMLKNQEEMSERFCKTILITLFILILPILAWAIGYFILSCNHLGVSSINGIFYFF